MHAIDLLAHFSNVLLLNGRFIRWTIANLHALLEKKPELRTTLQNLVNRDLARKLEPALLR